MEINIEKTKYHNYTFEYEFNIDKLSFCRKLKSKYGWKEFSYIYKKWRFNNPLIVYEILSEYPETKVDPQVISDYENAKMERKKEQMKKQKLNEIKKKKDSDIKIDGIKGELFPFQRVAVEFFKENNGKGILADVMGCISKTAIIKINRGGNCRKYTMEQVYKRFNGLEKKRKNWKLEWKTRSLNEETGIFELNKIKKVLYKGKKKVIKIKTEGGKELILTPDHKILSEEKKWIEVEKFNIGDKLFVNGKHFSQKNISKEIFIPQKDKITEIIEIEKEDVYDIVMDDPHRNFIANGVVVHNCGKTLESLAYVVYEKFNKTLVICPASVKHPWKNEVEKWTKLKPFVIDSKSNLSFEEVEKYNVFIINYDILVKFEKILKNIKFDCLIVDEVHYIKNRMAKRAKATMILSKNIESVLLLSGTPLLNRPIEIFNSLNMIDSKTWNNYWDFAKKYCNAYQDRFGWKVDGASNIDKLKENISEYFLRRTKEQVLPDLPPKHFIDFPVEMEGEEKNKYNMLINSFVKYLRDIKKRKDPQIRKTLQAQQLTRLNELKQLTSLSKVKIAEELIKYIIENEEKVLVFCIYKNSLYSLYEKFKDKAVIITGDVSTKDREKAKESFQNDPNTKIFFGGIQSAGVGITLTSGNNVIFVDYSWIPADHSQALNRAHRIGQTANQVTIYQLYCENTIDEKMKKVLYDKQKVFDDLFEDKSDEDNKQQGNMNTIVEEISKDYKTNQ